MKRTNLLNRNLALAALAAAAFLLPVARALAEESTPAADAAAGTTTAAVSPAEEAEKPWAIATEYSTSTDFADELKPRIFSHTVSVDASYEIKDWFGVSVGTGFFFKTIGGAISKFPEDSGINSVDVALSRVLTKPVAILGGKHTLAAAVFSSFPFSDDARLEGFYGSVGVGPMLTSKFFDGVLSVKNKANYSFIFNRYDYSPISQEANSTNSYGYSISGSVRVIGGLKVGAGFGMRRSRYTDGFHDFSYNNTQSISYLWKHWSAAISHSNGGYTEDGNVELWYIDKYRRVISGSLGYEF